MIKVALVATTDLPLQFDVLATDPVGPGGAHHDYIVQHRETGAVVATVGYQRGPRYDETSRLGLLDEHMLAIVAHRMECFQAGPFSSESNAKVLALINEARAELEARAQERAKRGVLGTNQK